MSNSPDRSFLAEQLMNGSSEPAALHPSPKTRRVPSRTAPLAAPFDLEPGFRLRTHMRQQADMSGLQINAVRDIDRKSFGSASIRLVSSRCSSRYSIEGGCDFKGNHLFTTLETLTPKVLISYPNPRGDRTLPGTGKAGFSLFRASTPTSPPRQAVPDEK